MEQIEYSEGWYSPQQMARQYFISVFHIPNWQIYVAHPKWAPGRKRERDYPQVVMCASLAPSNTGYFLGKQIEEFYGNLRDLTTGIGRASNEALHKHI